MRRVVLDSCVVVSAFRSRVGASSRLLELVLDLRLIPLATPTLFFEYEDVLKRDDQRAATGLTLDGVDVVLALLAARLEPVEVYFRWRPQLVDPDDEMVLDAAVNGRADVLVTHNIVDFARVAPRFGLEVIRPGEMLERLRHE